MPAFDTPGPISVDIDVVAGTVLTTVTDRTDTVVEVRPTRPARRVDVRVARLTRVEYADGRLLVTGPRLRHCLGLFRVGSVEVDLKLPAASAVRVHASTATVRAEGRLGDCRIRVARAKVDLDRAATLELRMSAGALVAGAVAGRAAVRATSGSVRLGEVGASSTVKTTSGKSWVGTATGDVQIATTSGSVSVDHALAGITTKTTSGHVRVGEAVHGPVSISSTSGRVDIGIPAGTGAVVDLHTTSGRAVNELDDGGSGDGGNAAGDGSGEGVGPENAGPVRVSARTTSGAILVHRC